MGKKHNTIVPDVYKQNPPTDTVDHTNKAPPTISLIAPPSHPTGSTSIFELQQMSHHKQRMSSVISMNGGDSSTVKGGGKVRTSQNSLHQFVQPITPGKASFIVNSTPHIRMSKSTI